MDEGLSFILIVVMIRTLDERAKLESSVQLGERQW